MKVVLNPMFDEARGGLGKIVFRHRGGQTIAGRKPTFAAEPTAEQAAHRERFKQAAGFGKSVMADSSLRALYQVMAESKDMSVFNAAVADFLTLPSIESVGLADYHGSIGDPIQIVATDEFGVLSVQVSILDAAGATLESGAAVETATGSGHWTYAGQTAIATGSYLTIEIIATDRPGGQASTTRNKSI
jgi:hypothetical protein